MCDCESPSSQHLVTDMAGGDVVCTQCGVVVQGHIFMEDMEYYSDRAGPRAGPPESWLLPAPPTLVDNMPHRRRALSNPDPHAALRKLFEAVDWMGRAFTTDVRETAKLLCRDLAKHRTLRSSAWHLYSACALYLATKMQGGGVGRSKKEITAMFASFGVTEHGLTATAKQFKEALHAATYAPKLLLNQLDATDLINRSVDRLDIADAAVRNAVKKAAHEQAREVPAREAEGKTPCSVCSGVVANVLQGMGIKLSKKHVAEACRVSGATLDKMTKCVQDWRLHTA